MDRMNADRFAAVMTCLRRHLNTCIPGSRVLRKDGAAASITGLPYAPFNSVWLERPNPPVSAVAALLDEVAGAGPFSLSLRPGSDAALADLAVERGMTSDGELPLMVLDATAGVGAIRRARGLAIRRPSRRTGAGGSAPPSPRGQWQTGCWRAPPGAGCSPRRRGTRSTGASASGPSRRGRTGCQGRETDAGGAWTRNG